MGLKFKICIIGCNEIIALIIAYEIAMGFALVGVIMVSGSLNLGEIINIQKGGVFNWLWVPFVSIIYYLLYCWSC